MPHLYIREGGKTQYVSAQTRSGEQAERLAQAERDKRDPVKLKLQKIAESEAAKDAVRLKPLLIRQLNTVRVPHPFPRFLRK
jgi:hypothetical protein